MDEYIQKHLPNDIHLPSNSTPADIRTFCNYYAFNPSALTHFSVESLISNPDLWIVGTSESEKRRTWTEEAYPKHIQPDLTNYVSILVCGKCKQRKVDYYKMQIRGADEPMTIFAHCLNCSHKWVQ
tara:strand:- start:697 stop:1074 length:378 start_codon:yes stop_codon:yes gene_type:complete